MHTRLFTIYLISVLWLLGFGQSNIKISFNLQAPGLSAAKNVFIAGSIEQLGYWRPDSVQMTFQGQDVWTKDITIKEPAVIEYKFTLGTWDEEGVDSSGFPLANFQINVDSDTIVQDTVLYWKQESGIKPEPTVVGTLKYHRNFNADSLLGRDILVWLPPGYQKETTRRYPVLYMHDGQNVFDAVTSSFGNEWRVDETCDSLIRAGKIPPLIVVAINNSSDRGREYHPGKTGTAYMEFVVKTLKPFIDTTYRSESSAKNTLVGGSSSGGIISFMLAWEYPHVFSKAICMSPALKIQGIDYVKVVQNSKGKPDIFFYMYNGGIDLEKKLQPGIDEMIIALQEKGYEQGEDFEVLIDPQAMHNEAAWARQFPQAIKACLIVK